MLCWLAWLLLHLPPAELSPGTAWAPVLSVPRLGHIQAALKNLVYQ